MNYYVFIDESGTPECSKIQSHFPVFTLCGVVFNHTSYCNFKESLDALKVEFWGHTNVILHSYHISQKNGDFDILKNSDVNKSFIDKLSNIISNADFKVLAVTIDKYRYIEMYGNEARATLAYEKALEFIVERSIYSIRRLRTSKTKIYFVPEKRNVGNVGKDKILMKYYENLIANGNEYLTTDSTSICNAKLEFRTKSQNVHGQQLADLCAYPIAKSYFDKENIHPSYPIIDSKFIRCMRTRKIDGFGLKIFPKIKTETPNLSVERPTSTLGRSVYIVKQR